MEKWIILVSVSVLVNFPRKTVAAFAEENFFSNFLLDEPIDEARCDQMQLEVATADSATIIDDIPKLNGQWVSQDCEIRPGPEFLLRSYSFTKNNSFRLLQHFYEDESCFLPLYTVTARGRLVLKKPSWVTPSGTESEYTLTRVTITGHTTEATEKLGREVKSHCSEVRHKTLKPHREYVIYNQRDWKKPFRHHHTLEGKFRKGRPKNSDCLSAMGIHFNELMLIRTQWRPVEKDKKNKELLLGDIHSRKNLRFTYNPTAFQVPLLKSDEAHGCFNCHIVSKENERALPHLWSKPVLPPIPHGQWISQRCEVRPFGMFLTRKLSFDSRDRTWNGEYKFHADPYCIESTFTVYASGKYVLGSFHSKEKLFRTRKTGTNFNFKIEETSLTLYDPTLRDTFNVEANCGVGPWYIGVAKDLLPTSGCSILEIVLPTTEHELIKLEIDNKGTPLLLMGLPDTENRKSLNERPTSYQAPLEQCSVFPRQNLLNSDTKPTTLAKKAPRSCSTEPERLGFACIFLIFISCIHQF